MWFRFPRGSLSAPLTTTIDQGSKNLPTLHAAHTIDSYLSRGLRDTCRLHFCSFSRVFRRGEPRVY